MTRRLKLFALVGAGAVGAGIWTYRSGADLEPPVVRTAVVSEGEIRKTVRATGALAAVTTVAVGTQVSGVVSWLGADFNSSVRKGQVIARLDQSLLQAQVEQARANLVRAETDVRQREVMLADRETKLTRASQLDARGLLSTSDLEAAALAATVARMDLESTRAQVVQAKASLNQVLVNLSHATITAPIDGIVTARNVDVGQTVAASLSSPTLFMIVGDLAKMQVSAAVDESDVAMIEAGQPVIVTVDAYPGRRFTGTVAQVRLQPTVTSNVTTYTTIVDVANERMELKPGMTAAAEFEIGRRSGVVRVPNGAIRFRPTAQMFSALNQPDPATLDVAASDEGGAARALRVSTRPPDDAVGTRGQVWVHEQGALRRIDVWLGLSDGTNTELLGDELPLGTEVVTSVQITAPASPAASPAGSPFGGTGRGRGRI